LMRVDNAIINLYKPLSTFIKITITFLNQNFFNVMKTVRFFILLGLSAIVFTNCKKDGSNDFEGVRVTVDGDEWVAPTTTGIAQAGLLAIIGTDGTGSKSLSISLPADVEPGTYELEPFGDIDVSFVTGGTTAYSAKSGELVVTEHAGNRIKGTFKFEGENLFNGGTASFTDGEFNVAYQ
jgi:hypothetical protein